MEEKASIVDDVEIDIILRELIKGSPTMRETQWPIETARWHAFVKSVLRAVGGPETPPDFVSAALDALIRFDLIDIEDLVDGSDETDDDASRIDDIELIREVIVRAGFSGASADKALAAIQQAAQIVAKGYDGRIQALLRRHGDAMVEALITELKISALDDATKRRVIVQWLQNILELPVPIRDRPIRIADNDIDISAFVAAADRADLNVAILDELLDEYELQSMQVPQDELVEPETEENATNV